MLKSYGVGGWWGGGPCDFSISPSPFGLDFGTLDFGLGLDFLQRLRRGDVGMGSQFLSYPIIYTDIQMIYRVFHLKF